MTDSPIRPTLQQWADQHLDAAYKQPLKTAKEAVRCLGWEYVARPDCCGAPVHIESMIGSAYLAECKSCGKFAVDVSGPRFAGTAAVQFMDRSQFHALTDWDRSWIWGVKVPEGTVKQ